MIKFIIMVIENKKIIIVLVGTALAILGGYVIFTPPDVPCQYQLKEIKRNDSAVDISDILNADAELNASVDSVFDEIKSYQGLRISEKTYWQGKRTHDEPVIYGTSAQADNLNCYASNAKKNWREISASFPNLPFQIEAHEYLTGKNEKGFQVFYYVQNNGRVYVKSKGYGVEEAQRTYGWQEVGKSYYTKE